MRERSKSVMLLMEITIMLLVFAICAGVCLTLFASSRRMSREAAELSEAAMWAQSAAEVYKSSGGDVAKAAETLRGDVNGGAMELWLDDDWQPGGRTYLLSCSAAGDIRVTRDGNVIYTLKAEAVTYGGE